MTNSRPGPDEKITPPEVHIHIHVHPPEGDPDAIARKIIKMINDYTRRHGGQDPFG